MNGATANGGGADAAPVAPVTGASRGLGLDIARALLQAGYRVVVTGTTAASTRQGVAALPAVAPGRLLGLPLSVSDEASVAQVLGTIESRMGRLDVLVNNAGIAPRVNGAKSRVEDTTLADWQRTLDVNMTGTFLVTRAAIALMRRHHYGRIINMVSRAGRTRSRLASAHYAASKAGIIGFSRILADEVGPDGITVNCIAPTRTASPMSATVADPAAIDRDYIAEIPLGRIGRVEDVSGVVLFLVSPAADFMTGAVLDVNGGQYMP